MLQSVRQQQQQQQQQQQASSSTTGGAPSSFPYSLVQKAAPIIHDILPLFVNLCSKIVQSWEQAQSVQKDLQSLQELRDVQEKSSGGSRPGTSSSSSTCRSEPMSSVPMSTTPRTEVVWMEVEQSFLLSVLVEAAVLMGTIMSLPSVYAKPSVASSSLGRLAEVSADSYSLNTVTAGPVALNVLTMSDRWSVRVCILLYIIHMYGITRLVLV